MRWALTKTNGKKSGNSNFGEKYTAFPKVVGVNLQEGELETAWTYKKIPSGQFNGLPECVTLYFR